MFRLPTALLFLSSVFLFHLIAIPDKNHVTALLFSKVLHELTLWLHWA